MKILLVVSLAWLPWAAVHAQAPTVAAKDEKKPVRTLRVLIAGQRAMPEFEKKGNQYYEVDPAAKWIMPTAVELLDAPAAAHPGAEKTPAAKKTVWPNELVNLGRYKGSATLRLRLIRTLSKQALTPLEVTCELGDLLEPLVVISAGDGGGGWNSPQVRVIDLSPAKVPFRTVVAINLTRIPLVTRFESAQGKLAPAAIQLLRLPASTSGVFRFRIDAQAPSGMFPLANSSYQLGASDRLLLLAIPNNQVAPGAPPLSLQLVLYKSAS